PISVMIIKVDLLRAGPIATLHLHPSPAGTTGPPSMCKNILSLVV
ncbi:MAG: hypothetical protein ACI83E_002881, partial [Sulfitobacter sp.]